MYDFTVLLVDDEEEFLATLLKRLRRRHIDVTGAPSGEAALEIMEECPRDVVVLDMKMPKMDGLETLKRLKEFHPATEVIMLTGHAGIEAAVQGMEAGAFDYLMKPTALDELLFKLEDAFRQKSLNRNRLQHRENTP